MDINIITTNHIATLKTWRAEHGNKMQNLYSSSQLILIEETGQFYFQDRGIQLHNNFLNSIGKVIGRRFNPTSRV